MVAKGVSRLYLGIGLTEFSLLCLHPPCKAGSFTSAEVGFILQTPT